MHAMLARCCAGLLGVLLLSAQASASGSFVVRPPQVEDRELRELVAGLQEEGVLQELAAMLNTLFLIPRDVGLRFSECGEANAYFSADSMEISMCAELFGDMESTFAEDYPDEDERQDAIANAFVALLLHEVGHALVEVLEIPITGREEDAVDQLAAWVLIEADMADAVLHSAETYYAVEDEADDATFADEHSLNKQRYFNMVCWVYGSDMAKHSGLVEEWELPEARAEQCEAEYQVLRRSWARLLDGHLRTAAPAAAPHRPAGATVGRFKVRSDD